MSAYDGILSAGGRIPAIGKNKRYEAHYDALNDMRIEEAASTLTPTTLPMQAYGREPIEWTRPGVPVWAWISWADGAATRIPCEATGWNDRVVCVEWEARGGRRSCVVWRTAVSRRP